MQETEYSDQKPTKKSGKQNNVLPLWGNEASMNLNPLILANIQSSSYFKVHLFKLKTYHEVVDEIYYQVKHLEPWERGSRKTAGQTGMCGSVRGVGAGGIVSSAYCLLYKLYTLRLTRKQVNGLITHTDSPYIRGLGFMYIRYSQPPGDLYSWYEDYLEDEEEIDVKAGGGQLMTIGQMVRQWLTKLDWFSTLFPRIPVPIQKQIEQKLNEYDRQHNVEPQQQHFNAPAQTATTSRSQNWERERPPKETYKEYEEYQRGGAPPAREREEYDERRRYREEDDYSYKERVDERRSHKKSKKHSRSRDRSRSRSHDKHKSNKDKKRRDYDDYSKKKHRSRSRSRERSHRDKDRRKY